VAIARTASAPLAAWRVAIRICFGNLPNPPFCQPWRTGTARYLAHCYPYMFRQSAKSAIPPAVMQCTARATEPETTGRMPRGAFGAEPAGRIVAPVKRGTVTGTEAGAPSGDCRHLAMPNLTLSATLSVLLARCYQATRDYQGIASASGDYTATKCGQRWQRTAHGATTSIPAKYDQRRHRTARIHVADYARPATLTQHWQHRSRGDYVRTGEVWPTSAPYRSRSRG
jgi:hypothetical protein